MAHGFDSYTRPACAVDEAAGTHAICTSGRGRRLDQRHIPYGLVHLALQWDNYEERWRSPCVGKSLGFHRH